MKEHSLIPDGSEARHSAKPSLHAGFTWGKKKKVKSAKSIVRDNFPCRWWHFLFFGNPSLLIYHRAVRNYRLQLEFLELHHREQAINNTHGAFPRAYLMAIILRNINNAVRADWPLYFTYRTSHPNPALFECWTVDHGRSSHVCSSAKSIQKWDAPGTQAFA